MKTMTMDIQKAMSSDEAKDLLVQGNERFVQGKELERNLLAQVKVTSTGQAPFAVILSCIDSRVPVELIFNLGIGDVFSTRVAGNIVNDDVLGSLEYSCRVAGSKLVVVMGHTSCGAVTAACNNVQLGNITTLLNKIQPAINSANLNGVEMSKQQIEQVSVQNVQESINEIRKKSPILADMESVRDIEIVGAMYDVVSGRVTFL
jgi:carbonic anhydrase